MVIILHIINLSKVQILLHTTKKSGFLWSYLTFILVVKAYTKLEAPILDATMRTKSSNSDLFLTRWRSSMSNKLTLSNRFERSSNFFFSVSSVRTWGKQLFNELFWQSCRFFHFPTKVLSFQGYSRLPKIIKNKHTRCGYFR